MHSGNLGKCLCAYAQESTGGGLVYWHPKGAMCRHIIETFWKDLHLARGYELIYRSACLSMHTSV